MSDPGPSAGWPAASLRDIEAELCAEGSHLELEDIVVEGRVLRCWKNQHASLVHLARAASAAHADRDLIVFEDERVTYDGWYRAVARLSAALMARGIGKGDRVAIAMRNLPEWPVAFFAAVAAGAIAVPLNAWWTGRELRHGLAQSGSRLLICDAERWDRVRPELPTLPALETALVCRTGETPSAIGERLEGVIGHPAGYGALPEHDLPDVAIGPDDPATILYTSGTTGAPKGALATHRSNLIYILGAVYAAERTARRRGDRVREEAPPVLLSPVPLFHVTGLNACLFPLIDAGGTLVMMRKWDAPRALELIERHKVTKLGGVPTIAWDLLHHPELDRFDLGSLKTVFYGGASSPPELAQRIAAELRAVPSNGWGMTELCAVGTTHSAEDYLNRPDSCGPPNPGTELRIVDRDSGEILPPGEVGELWVRGAHVIRGYWNNPEATAATIRDGWFRTGDLARLDEEGFCFIVGRAKEMIIRGGENIYPLEIENVLYQHPAVADASVVGIAHPTLGEEVAAAVRLTDGQGLSEAGLRAWLADHVAAYKIPVKIAFVVDALPRNANGKIMKNAVRDLITG